jgi:hypothetical protein
MRVERIGFAMDARTAGHGVARRCPPPEPAGCQSPAGTPRLFAQLRGWGLGTLRMTESVMGFSTRSLAVSFTVRCYFFRNE